MFLLNDRPNTSCVRTNKFKIKWNYGNNSSDLKVINRQYHSTPLIMRRINSKINRFKKRFKGRIYSSNRISFKMNGTGIRKEELLKYQNFPILKPPKNKKKRFFFSRKRGKKNRKKVKKKNIVKEERCVVQDRILELPIITISKISPLTKMSKNGITNYRGLRTRLIF